MNGSVQRHVNEVPSTSALLALADQCTHGGNSADVENPTPDTWGELMTLPPEQRTTMTLVTMFAAGKVRRGEWTPYTLQINRSRLGQFARAMPTPSRITAKRVDRWVHGEAADGFAPQYRASRLSTARGFTKWATANGYLRRDPCLEVGKVKIPPAMPRALRGDEVATLLESCTDLRTRLCVLLMCQEGLRRAEVAAIDLGDIDFREHSLQVRGKNGQGQVTAALPISDETWSTMLDYLDGTRAKTGKLIRNDTHKSRSGLTPNRVGQIVSTAMRDAGVKRFNYDGRSAHALRHTAAHDILDHTHNIYAVKQALRHASVTSTQIYLRGAVHDLRDTMGGRTYGSEATA